MFKSEAGSAPIGFVLAAPIGLLLLLTSFELSGLVWKRSLMQHELSEVVQTVARRPLSANSVFQNYLSNLKFKPEKASLKLVEKGEIDLYVGSIQYRQEVLGLTAITFKVRALEVVEP